MHRLVLSPQGDNGSAGPYRYRVGNDGHGTHVGWAADYQFHGLNYPAPGTVPVYVMDAGGQGPGNWHRYKLSLTDDAQATGWRNQFTIYAYPA